MGSETPSNDPLARLYRAMMLIPASGAMKPGYPRGRRVCIFCGSMSRQFRCSRLAEEFENPDYHIGGCEWATARRVKRAADEVFQAVKDKAAQIVKDRVVKQYDKSGTWKD